MKGITALSVCAILFWWLAVDRQSRDAAIWHSKTVLFRIGAAMGIRQAPGRLVTEKAADQVQRSEVKPVKRVRKGAKGTRTAPIAHEVPEHPAVTRTSKEEPPNEKLN